MSTSTCRVLVFGLGVGLAIGWIAGTLVSGQSNMNADAPGLGERVHHDEATPQTVAQASPSAAKEPPRSPESAAGDVKAELAQPPVVDLSLPAGKTAPRTAAQREAFVKVVVEPRLLDVSRECWGDLMDRLRSSLKPDLPIDERAKADQTIGEVCAAEVAYRTEFASALANYVRSAPDLATSASSRLKDSRGGTITYGVQPGSEALWGTAKEVVVNYNLRYADHARLAVAADQLKAAKQKLRAYQ